MFGNKDIPVYLFTGFLESGKTTCIKEILEEGNFEDGLKTLFLITEEGETEVDENLLRYNKVTPVVIEDEDDFTEEKCIALVKEYKPARIMIEVNGMWDMAKLINETIPENWIIVQTFTTVNAETFQMYINNMKPLLMAHFQQSDLVIFNRCQQDMDKPSMMAVWKATLQRNFLMMLMPVRSGLRMMISASGIWMPVSIRINMRERRLSSREKYTGTALFQQILSSQQGRR